jgi:hypothetical protein
MDSTRILVDDKPHDTRSLSLRLRANGHEVLMRQMPSRLLPYWGKKSPIWAILNPGLPMRRWVRSDETIAEK